jgi:hypothetical protein
MGEPAGAASKFLNECFIAFVPSNTLTANNISTVSLPRSDVLHKG